MMSRRRSGVLAAMAQMHGCTDALMPDAATFRNVTLEEWEARQPRRALDRVQWPVFYRWAMFRMWLWKRMHGD